MNPRSVTAFAPGSVGNVGPGLDILGLAVGGAGDRVTATWSETPGITITDAGRADLPTDPTRNTAGLAAAEVLRRAGPAGWPGLTLSISKGLPLSGGQGGSAASAVAAGVAVNRLLGWPLTPLALLEACLTAEAAVAGRHADNLAPSLLGGLVLIRSTDPLDVIALQAPEGLLVVLAHPDQQLRTVDSRTVLPAQVDRDLAMRQAAQVAAIVAGIATRDFSVLGRAINDEIAEPARAPLLPGFREAKAAAMKAGALGSSISGSGPTAFALAVGPERAEQIARAMAGAYQARGIHCNVRVAPVDGEGARIEKSEE